MKIDRTLRGLVRPSPVAPIAAGDRARDLRQWDEAARHYAEAVRIAPARADIWVQHGHALKEGGDLTGAEAAYRRALAIAPAVADTHLHLGHLLKVAGRPADAADAYLDALVRDPALADALRELHDLQRQGVPMNGERLRQVLDRPVPVQAGDAAQGTVDVLLDRLLARPDLAAAEESVLRDALAAIRQLTPVEPAPDAATIVFDASDVIHHFRHSRLPTGIQRVQLAIIRALLRDDEQPVAICALFDDRWVGIPASLFLALAELSIAGGATVDPAWRTATMALELHLGIADALAFPQGAWLVNLGTSWFVDYLLHVRTAQRAYGIRYVPFVHDCIPLVAPRFVLPQLTRDYVGWLVGAIDLAHLFLANSRSTRADLIDAAHRLGHVLDEDRVRVVPLDAQFAAPPVSQEERRAFLRRHDLLGRDFVLFVATVEPRKNHLGAFEVWRALLDRRTPTTPRLVCVGGRGWLNEEVFARVAADDDLARHVRFLHDLSDAELAICYDACLFTLYPSLYEGWGLPVTESLCHGKVPVLARNSSLPEAGGAFADYADLSVPGALLSAVSRLIDDPVYRAGREAAIAAGFVPRRWRDLAADLAAQVAQAGERTIATAPTQAGTYYPLARNAETQVRSGAVSGAAARIGEEWHTPEDWGCWTRGGSAELALCIGAAGSMRLYVGLKGLPDRPCRVRLTAGTHWAEAPLAPSATRWVSVILPADAVGPIEVTITSDTAQDLDIVTEGRDTRVIGPGVYGFYLCGADDTAARLDLVEAIALGTLASGPLRDRTMPVDAPPAAPRTPPHDEAGVAVSAVAEPDGGGHPEPDAPDWRDEAPATDDAIVLLQSSDAFAYWPMLQQSMRTTIPFCERHGIGYRSFIGIKRGDRAWHASYNRIDLLSDLVAEGFRGWVLWIDADGWINDLDFDLAHYLADKRDIAFIAAPAGHERDHFWNVNNGIFLANLGHPFARHVVAEWNRSLSRYDLASQAFEWNVEVPDDQGMFHQIIDKHPEIGDAFLIVDKRFFNSPWASFVRQAIRAEHADFASRLATVTTAVDAVLAGERGAGEPVADATVNA